MLSLRVAMLITDGSVNKTDILDSRLVFTWLVVRRVGDLWGVVVFCKCYRPVLGDTWKPPWNKVEYFWMRRVLKVEFKFEDKGIVRFVMCLSMDMRRVIGDVRYTSNERTLPIALLIDDGKAI